MKFGIMNLLPFADGKSSADIFRETLEETAYAEELGFDSVWLAEHHFSRYGILGNPLVLGAAIAERTKRIRIGTAVVIAPFYDPIRLAEDAALVDALSGGRLDLGIGRGYQPIEFNGFGISQEEASARTEEIIDILKLAWAEGSFSYSGKYYNYNDLTVYPKPVQQGGVPIWRAAVSQNTFNAVGQTGTPILTSPNFTPLPIVRKQYNVYRQALQDGGFDVESYDFPMMQQVYVGTSEQDAYDTPRKHSEWFYKMLGSLVPGEAGKAVKGYEGYETLKANIADIDYDQIVAEGANFGTSASVNEKIRVLRDDIGVSHYIGWFNVGGLDHKKVMESMKRFADDVMPNFR
jgi:alkanesulfonate monooxygenase SsuD/methylene tetrahydromethanopterin reductase-like flavin-dependent oxidoreductase (luciferase family)